MNRSLIGRLLALSVFVVALVGSSSGCSRDASQDKDGRVSRTSGALQMNITNGFNGNDIKAGSYIWFTLRCNPVGVPQTTANSSSCAGGSQTITFSSGGNNYVLPVPDGKIVYSSTTTEASTEWDGTQWVTVVPINYQKTIFITGLSYYVATDLPGSIS